MRVILCGFHWTGCEALRCLLAAGHDVYVYTHEGPYFVPSLIEYCQHTRTPYSLENISHGELAFRPDVIASIYYRNIIKQPVIDACEGRIFNLHPSLLPAYRGCSSLTWAMVHGQSQAGFSFHYVDQGCDTGDILIQEAVAIHPFDTQSTLYQRVSFRAMQRFDEALAMAAEGKPGTPQHGESSYYRRGCPYNGEIDPNWSTQQINNFIRAMNNPPYPPATFQGVEVRTLAEFLALQEPSHDLETVFDK